MYYYFSPSKAWPHTQVLAYQLQVTVHYNETFTRHYCILFCETSYWLCLHSPNNHRNITLRMNRDPSPHHSGTIQCFVSKGQFWNPALEALNTKLSQVNLEGGREEKQMEQKQSKTGWNEKGSTHQSILLGEKKINKRADAELKNEGIGP